MKYLTYSIACMAILLLATACTTPRRASSLYPQPSDFVGEYQFKYDKATMVLKCVSNTECNVSVLSPTEEQADKGENYTGAIPLTDTSQLQFAFEYAQEHRNDTTASDEDKQTLKALAPLLDQKTYVFDTCIDLIPEEMPKYLVACKPKLTPWDKPTVLLFGTLLTGTCSGPFCRYVITPLHAKVR